MSQRRTIQERARIVQQKKEQEKAYKDAIEAETNARKQAWEHMERLSPTELELEQQECLEVWRKRMGLQEGDVLYWCFPFGGFSRSKCAPIPLTTFGSKAFRDAFPFLSDYKGNIGSFAIDYNGAPIINGLLPEESKIPECAWRKYLHEETLVRVKLYATAALDECGHTLIEQMQKLGDRVFRDEMGNLSYIHCPAEEQMFNTSAHNLTVYQKLIELDYGRGLNLVGVEKASSPDGVDWLFLESTTKEATCPFCGGVSSKQCGTYTRELDDIPSRPHVHKKICVHGHVYQCEACKANGISDSGTKVCGYFRERLEIARPDAHRTNRLDAWILMLISNGSFHNAERCLKQMGCPVGDDAIRRLLMAIQFYDDPAITAIGVDDVSLRKGQTYATVIYALSDHRLLCVLMGRDGKGLREWLEKHPHVRTIARDRGTAYAKTIDSWAKDHGIESEVIQVADRFHLIKNFIDQVKDHCYSYLPSRIAIDRNTLELMDTIPTKIAIAKIPRPSEEQMLLMNYTNDEIYDLDNNPIVIVLSSLGAEASDEGSMTPGQKKREEEKEQNRVARYEKYKGIRAEYNSIQKHWGIYQELAEKYGVSSATIKKYCEMTDADFEACWGSERNSERKPRLREIDGYVNMMYRMFTAGLNIGQVFWYVREKGFSQADSTLIHYVVEMYKYVFPKARVPLASDYLKLEYPENVYVVTRCNLIKYFLTVNPDTEKDPMLVKCEDAILEKYPNIKLLKEYFNDYHSAIMGDDPDAIERFAENCRIPEFQGFHDKLKRDMKAVKAAIQFPENSGLVEGGNNKYKTVLRTHYGRLKLATLEQACMFSSWHARPDFRMSDIVWWFPSEYSYTWY